jgi:hypothetical protein
VALAFSVGPMSKPMLMSLPLTLLIWTAVLARVAESGSPRGGRAWW